MTPERHWCVYCGSKGTIAMERRPNGWSTFTCDNPQCGAEARWQNTPQPKPKDTSGDVLLRIAVALESIARSLAVRGGK